MYFVAASPEIRGQSYGLLGGHSSAECTCNWSLLYAYVNDMTLQVQHGCLLQFAYDTCLICLGDTPSIVAQALQDDLCMY